jgi:hypothetical protein
MKILFDAQFNTNMKGPAFNEGNTPHLNDGGKRYFQYHSIVHDKGFEGSGVYSARKQAGTIYSCSYHNRACPRKHTREFAAPGPIEPYI